VRPLHAANSNDRHGRAVSIRPGTAGQKGISPAVQHRDYAKGSCGPAGGRQAATGALPLGLIPSWAKDKKIAYSTINARSDTVATKPAFRSAFKRRRCLVLADGYYEWEKSGKSKLPWLYEVDGGKPFAFAGLWESWKPAGADESLESCTIITTDANELASQVHVRMPVILDSADHDAWLAGEQIPLIPFPPERMSTRPISTLVNNARNEGPECIEPRY